jgi:hypothetical protein
MVIQIHVSLFIINDEADYLADTQACLEHTLPGINSKYIKACGLLYLFDFNSVEKVEIY